MKATKFKMNKDKSATITMDLTADEEQILIEYAINDILKKIIKRLKKEGVKNESSRKTINKNNRIN